MTIEVTDHENGICFYLEHNTIESVSYDHGKLFINNEPAGITSPDFVIVLLEEDK